MDGENLKAGALVNVKVELPAELKAAAKRVEQLAERAAAKVEQVATVAVPLAWWDGCRTGAFAGVVLGLLLACLLWRKDK